MIDESIQQFRGESDHTGCRWPLFSRLVRSSSTNPGSNRRGKRPLLWLCCIVLIGAPSLFAQLNDNCVVSVLNRNVQVNADGTWVLPNIPANFGPVRARATCVNNGVTQFGQSDFFTIQANGSANVPPIILGPTTPIPNSMSVAAQATTLSQAGATAQLTVTATYAGGNTQDVTSGASGTLYNVSNPAIATVSPGGLVTAVRSGTAVIQAVNEGTQGIINIQVILAEASHGGIPDSWAIAHGLDPNDPAMPFEDPDHDGLTNLQEFQNGTDPHNPDTDGDGLTDGQEVLMYHTSPLLASTDGTGIPDGVEVQTGTLGGSLSAKLAAALRSIEVKPSTFVLNVNAIQGLASQQLQILGRLIDGKTTLDLTSTQKGTSYSSSDLNTCNFGAPDGNIFAGSDGTCTITIANNGFSAQAVGIVRTFSPTALSFITIPGFANSVDVNGNFAYVAAGSAGLQVVNVSDRSHPSIVASLSLPGNANDVKLLGNLAYVAAGSAGLHVVDVTNPLAPVRLGTLSTAANALDIAVRGTRVYIANGSNLFIADVTNPAVPTRISSLALNGTIQGVDVDAQRNLAVVAAGTNGIYTVDVSNPSAPAQLGRASTGDAREVAVSGNFAFVADFQNSTTSVDITAPSAPLVLSHILDPNLGGFLLDIVVSGNFTLAADVKFVNGIPITDISDPANLRARAILSFPQRDDNGMGIAADGSFVYLVTDHNSLGKFGSSGDSRLYIGQYLALVDNKGVPPTAAITSPADGSTVIAGSTLPITVTATDDVAVAAVNFMVNGQTVFTATSAPYQFNFTVPSGASTLTLGARAVDLGGNIGTAQTVTLNVVPDPGTTVTGKVVDSSQNGLAGATVTTVGGLSATTQSDGSFIIANVSTVLGNIVVNATATANGIALRGSSSGIPPVRGGTTDVGNIIVSPNTAYFAFNPNDQGALKLLGWADNTTFNVFRLDQPGGVSIANGVLNRFQNTTIGLAGTRHFRVVTSTPVQATLGFDCCNFGGSFFYPSLDGRSMVGRSFIIRIPVLSDPNEFIIFAYQPSQVTIRNTAGAVVLSRTIPADGFFATTGGPLSAGTVYQIESTGDISMQSNSRNAHTSTPSSNGSDVGTKFLFGTRVWDTSSIAVFAYENATVTGTNLENGAQVFTTTLTAGQNAYFNGFGDNKFKVESTGNIGVWSGSTEGGTGIASMGDNLTINTGSFGQNFFIHSQTQGAFVFALDDNTAVNIDGTARIINLNQLIDIPAGAFHHITSSKPVIVETVGGNGLNDWETSLRLVP